ncbi:MAG TPA: hypothetical protein DCO77_10790 [Nitrospiraceae bacterium]|nr:hypothetical protein [Nitrospiraceae bacterium]
MNRNGTLITVLILMIVCFFGVSQASAGGTGFLVSTSSGDVEWEVGFPAPATHQYDSSEHTGFGFVLDTAVAKNSLFNYQLNFVFDSWESSDGPGGQPTTVDIDMFTFNNSFGFGIVRTEGFRFWFGPEIRIGWGDGAYGVDSFDIFGFGVGLAAGFNFHVSDDMSLALKIGQQKNMNYSASDWDYDAEEDFTYFNVMLLFRSSGDTYM